MTAQLLFLLGTLIGVAAALAFFYVVARSLLSDIWKFALVVELPSRRRAGSILLCLISLTVAWAFVETFGTAGYKAGIFFVAAITPALGWYALSWWAWCRDDGDTRRAALEIAAERAERFGEPVPQLTQRSPWKDYIFDVETAARRARYEPPPI